MRKDNLMEGYGVIWGRACEARDLWESHFEERCDLSWQVRNIENVLWFK